MGDTIEAGDAVKYARFESNLLPPGERIKGFETFLKGASKGVTGEYQRLLFRPLDRGNPNFVRFERLSADDTAFSVTNASGMIMGADSNKRPSSIVLSLVNRGAVDVQTTRQTMSLRQKDIYINAAASDYQIDVGPSEVFRVMLPLDLLQPMLEGVTGIAVLRRASPIAEILETTIRKLDGALRSGSRVHIRQLSGIARDITQSVLLQEIADLHQDGYEIIRARARYFIEDNISSSELDIDSIAEHAHASRATLYRAFEQLGGVRAYVNQVRLDQARRMLASPVRSRAYVLDVAYACGFSNPGSFGRLFKRQFGMSPSEFMAQAAHAETKRHDPEKPDHPDAG
ncbi:MAG: helix-turn-helix transcriptional regulator [Alphaproteobacteria bacterium]|nr:helix-turn-helix transcriptional regulator [Alphaproteobacteria bacterium]